MSLGGQFYMSPDSNPRKPRRGYRLAHKDIAREWMIVGKALIHKRVYRLWRR
jgi:hypothetical protein